MTSQNPLDRFEEHWRRCLDSSSEACEPPEIESFLGDVPMGDLAQMLERLVEIDVWYRRRANLQIDLANYEKRFPAHLVLIRRAVAAEFVDDSSAEELPRLTCPSCGQPLQLTNDARQFQCTHCPTHFDTRPADRSTARAIGHVGHYEIIGLLGQGGFARVWFAKDMVTQKYVALKIPKRPLDPEIARRFLRETKIAYEVLSAAPCAECIPRLESCGKDGDVPYIAFEFLNAVPLSELLAEHRRLTPRRAAQICRNVAVALQLAHDGDLIHRDVKPSNILVTDDRAYLTDFGIAKSMSTLADHNDCQTRGFIGTPAYAAPEQRQGEADARSDIYSLGVVLVEALAGSRPPHATPNVAEDWLRSRRPGISPVLEQICTRCLAQSPSERFQSAGELTTALDTFLLASNHEQAQDLIATFVPSLAAKNKSPSGIRVDATRTRVSGVAKIWPWLASSIALVALFGWTFWNEEGKGPESEPNVRDVVDVPPPPPPPPPSRPPLEELKELAESVGGSARDEPANGGPPTVVVDLSGLFVRQDDFAKIIGLLMAQPRVKLELKNGTLTDELLFEMSKLGDRLAYLDGSALSPGTKYKYSQAGLNHLSACKNLNVLIIGGAVEDLEFAKGMVNLRILRIFPLSGARPEIDDDDLRKLGGTRVESLTLSGCRRVTLAGDLKHLQHLVLLSVADCGLNNQSYDSIAALPRLTTLQIDNKPTPTLRDLERLRPAGSLERLKLNGRLKSEREALERLFPPPQIIDFGHDN